MDSKGLIGPTLVTFLAFTGTAAAIDPIGQIKAAYGDVQVERSGQIHHAIAGDDIFVGDSVSTGSNGAFGITFVDQTRMSSGPECLLVLKVYRFNTTTHAGVFNAALQHGTLLVVPGEITQQTPEAMKIATVFGSVEARRKGEFIIRAIEPLGGGR